MNEVVYRAKCYEEGCGGTMEGRKGEYKYTQGGLRSVVLSDIVVFHCTKCNAVVPEIPAAGVLHRVIALNILCKKTLLSGSELRFLRKLCGYSVSEFSEIMGTSKDVVSRWENHDKAGKGTDRTVRLLVAAKLIREIAGQPDPILRNVTVEQLGREVESALKEIQSRRTHQKYNISPEEIARVSGAEHVHNSANLSADLVQ